MTGDAGLLADIGSGDDGLGDGRGAAASGDPGNLAIGGLEKRHVGGQRIVFQDGGRALRLVGELPDHTGDVLGRNRAIDPGFDIRRLDDADGCKAGGQLSGGGELVLRDIAASDGTERASLGSTEPVVRSLWSGRPRRESARVFPDGYRRSGR